ncbi:D-glucosaminate-6-phosphate ammonia lyase [Paraburkholderia nemoris]|nr:aminotransferase class V-fold PLP-dependent enzyme [Paraburkholderia aspalathi]MBK3786565.1 aminotransferase class V-fold PLP-dependent enzyme [Paraburkholderia aspalathi]CAE6857822.1 D-glucosaminate-6-phosphate ammonia lyase [Paraburkholderia nemoris]
MNQSDINSRLGLHPVINVAGTMTYLGSSIVVPEAVEAISAMLPHFVDMSALHRRASETIARACGAEAGFVTASCAAGISLSVAAAMTGDNLAAIERLPDTSLLKNRVVIQAGHMVHYGAPLEQAIRLSGAVVVPVGQATQCLRHQLEASLGNTTAAAVYVVSHHTVQFGQLPLDEFVAVCHAQGVPVIVDAASEYDLRRFIATGADVVLYSAHKFLGGPTAGIVAGKSQLVRSIRLQNRGIGRGMKVGKESIVGTIAALDAWEKRDHAAVRARENRILGLWHRAFAQCAGVQAAIVPDPTSNPLDRLKLIIDPSLARITAWDLADLLAAGNPSLVVRDHEVEHGFFLLDPCNLHDGQEQTVVELISAALEAARLSPEPIITGLDTRRANRARAVLA